MKKAAKKPEGGLRMFREWLSLKPELLWAYDGAVDPSVRHHLALRTGRMSAWLLRRGSVRLVSDDAVLRVGTGEWVFFSGGFQRHDFTKDARVLSVSLKVPDGAAAVWRHEPFKVKAAGNGRLERAARLLVATILKRGGKPGGGLHDESFGLEDFLRVDALGLEWAAEYVRQLTAAGGAVKVRKRQDARVSAALRLLEATPFQKGFSELKLARAMKLSAGHLERLFQRETGATPRQVWERLRKEEAGWRVPHAETPLKQLAFELGFCSQAHFSGWYRRTFGLSPSAARARAGGAQL